MLYGFPKPPPFLLRDLMDGLFRVQIRKIQHDGDEFARQEIMQSVLGLLPDVFPEVSADPCIQLLRRERGLQIDGNLHKMPGIQFLRCSSAQGQNQGTRYAEMREQHLPEQLLQPLSLGKKRHLHIAQGKPLRLLWPFFLGLQGNERRKQFRHRMAKTLRHRIAIPGRAGSRIGSASYGQYDRVRGFCRPIFQPDTADGLRLPHFPRFRRASFRLPWQSLRQ